MKMLLGFFIGMTTSLLLVMFFFSDSIFVKADSDATAVSVSGEAVTSPDDGYTTLLPDVKKIYNVALAAPYQQVESEITDPDIAAFFRRYMEETGLDKIGTN